MSCHVSMSCHLQALRQSAALTQEQLAHDLGVSQGLVSSWESGRLRPNPPQLLALERVCWRARHRLLEERQRP